MTQDDDRKTSHAVDRRTFIARTAAATSAITVAGNDLGKVACAANQNISITRFAQTDSWVHGPEWQTLNPGYWKIENGALRRRLRNYGDRARKIGFPFHAATHGFEYKTEYDPTQLPGVIYHQHYQLSGRYKIKATFTFRGQRPSPAEGDNPSWKMYQPGTGMMGVAIGAKSVFESHQQLRQASLINWTDDGKFGLTVPVKKGRKNKSAPTSNSKPVNAKDGPSNLMINRKTQVMNVADLSPGDRCVMEIDVQPLANESVKLTASLLVSRGSGNTENRHTFSAILKSSQTSGYAGVACGGLIDFEVNEFSIEPFENQQQNVGVNDCFTCYPLGDTLKQVDEKWQVRFVSLFTSDGETVELRVADSETPAGGWKSVPIAGTAKIVTNKWRRNTATIEAILPHSPADKEMYYTVWKDGVDVTFDQRIGTDACGPGTGFVGDVPVTGKYVGRLPQLTAPYKVCGLSCHAISQSFQTRTDHGWQFNAKRVMPEWTVRDQPSPESFRHLDEYNFQIMLWEDDVWYMEMLLYPPSTDDAYKVVTQSICGPTSRWQMMRHWNVINPGDHEYGMDDFKGPEQLVLRNTEGLGQDSDYLRRNFQIVHHLTTGDEEIDPSINPKKWRSWKMPNRDFTMIVLDSRLWRNSQDVDIWDDAGWGAFKSLYDRTDPTRSLLGEEQFSWLERRLTTDSSPLICLTGISGLHTVWTGAKYGNGPSLNHPKRFDQRDRVTADYAGWVKAGADRVLELLGSRDGIVTVYGDVHNGCIMKNIQQRVIECSFGPIGRNNGRALIPGFGPKMKDVDERDLEVTALYHENFSDANQSPHAEGDPHYWNFLEMEFDPQPADPIIGLRIRNMIDSASEPPRGGGSLETVSSTTGREITSRLPAVQTLPNADVRWSNLNGQAIRATRSDANGNVHVAGLVDISPGTDLIMVTFDGTNTESKIVRTL